MTVVVYVFGDKPIPGLRNFLLDYSLLHIYSPHQQDAFGPLLQSWTLSTELAFYVFVPLWALLMRRVARGDVRSRLRAQLAGVVVLVGGVRPLEGVRPRAPDSARPGSASSRCGCRGGSTCSRSAWRSASSASR